MLARNSSADANQFERASIGMNFKSRRAVGPANNGIFNTLGSPGSAPHNVHLKAETNKANGGIGITHSNVVLAGGLNPAVDGHQFIAKKDTDYSDPRT